MLKHLRPLNMELPKWTSGKESACQYRRCGFDPWVGKIPCRRKWQSTQVFSLRKFHGQRSLVGYSQWGLKESDTTEHTPFQFSSVQLLSRVWLLVTPWIAARQASLSITNSWSSPKLMSIESLMLSSCLILCRPLLLLPLVPPSSRVFSNESTLRMRWPKYWSFSFSISPSNEHPGLISFKDFEMNIIESSQKFCWTARVQRSQVSWVEVKGLVLCVPFFLLFPWTPIMKIHMSVVKKNTEILKKNVKKCWPAGTSTCCAIDFFDAWRYVYVCVFVYMIYMWCFFPFIKMGLCCHIILQPWFLHCMSTHFGHWFVQIKHISLYRSSWLLFVTVSFFFAKV